jgi:predicted RNA-binding protein (virulence factor B family)
MSCESCLTERKARQQQYAVIYKNAKNHAILTQKFMVIYSLPDGSYAYMEVEAAQREGVFIVSYVSYMQ